MKEGDSLTTVSSMQGSPGGAFSVWIASLSPTSSSPPLPSWPLAGALEQGPPVQSYSDGSDTTSKQMVNSSPSFTLPRVRENARAPVCSVSLSGLLLGR